MIRTRVGYTGGTKPGPTYRDLGDHSEAVQVEYDPSQVSYEELLALFWKDHDPTRRSWFRQYKAALFYHSEEQQRLALASRDWEAAERQGRIHTEILPASTFYPAEDYHQKYWLRQDPRLLHEFRAMYPDAARLVNSTAAARVNGVLGGAGTRAGLQAELAELGLSAEAQQHLLGVARGPSR